MKLLLIIARGAQTEEVTAALRALPHELVVIPPPQREDLSAHMPFDCIIGDLLSPSAEPAAELLTTLRRLRPAEEIPLLALIPMDRAAEALRAGFDDILVPEAPLEILNLRVVRSGDASKTRQSERAREASERLLQEITDQIPGVVYRFILEPDGTQRMPYVSGRVEEIFALTSEDVVDMEPLYAKLHPDDVQAVNQSIAHSAVTMTPWELEFRILVRGSYRWFIGHSLPRPGEDGAIVWHGMFRDVTHRKALEDRLRIADRMASIGTLSAGITHEINNPLAFLTSNLSSSLEDLEHLSPTQLEEALLAALRGAERIEEIISGLKAFAYVRDTPMEPVNLRQVLEDALQIATPDLRKRAALLVNIQSTASIIGRRNDIVQVLLNLFINASQALDPEQHETNRIEVELTDDGSHATLRVTDTGQGIAPEDLEKIFDPFYTTKSIGEGTGLGLYVCHNLIASMDGRIDVESTPDVSTSFRLVFPILS